MHSDRSDISIVPDGRDEDTFQEVFVVILLNFLLIDLYTFSVVSR